MADMADVAELRGHGPLGAATAPPWARGAAAAWEGGTLHVAVPSLTLTLTLTPTLTPTLTLILTLALTLTLTLTLPRCRRCGGARCRYAGRATWSGTPSRSPRYWTLV